MSKDRRVVVTGMGIVSCFGMDVDHFYNQLLAGKSGVDMITAFDCSEYPTRFAAEVKDFETGDYIDKKQARRVDPFIRYSMVAGKKALEHAGLDEDKLAQVNKDRAGVIIGSGMGGMGTFSNGWKTVHEKGFKRLTPFFVPYIITNMGGALLSMDLGFTGPNYSISTACATGTHSIIAAARHIQHGDADLMICGGAEAPVNEIGLAGFVACKALSTNNDNPQVASRPWDTGRDGFVMGEGSGVLILEEYESAKARGANIIAEYLGGYVNADAYHITEPYSDGHVVARCMKEALADGNVPLERVNYVNAHATSTPVGDLCEMRGIKSIFGAKGKDIWVNGTKSMTGHCLGAAGAIEAIAVLKAFETGKLHPTINIDNLEPELEDMALVRSEVKDLEVDVALSNSFGFGGHNGSIAFGRLT
ncbi:MAG: 3-oxoacyl-[acyl-carrier-protein] synthase 2 [Chlamydiia bacterium]|nr:3-oxoacyl-[acyl-carrier-protein] synthase 2 [Chlamydiia bacterium]MCH9615198.1 3-oxoacyl-[acyl-carrier-protein] synthase 2 [Chlamydiia bacterium]MCH9628480.1 3-oxoacyl-[acyl-carrier-protein] synthase 2 [Chlamydiia bacterium]